MTLHRRPRWRVLVIIAMGGLLASATVARAADGLGVAPDVIDVVMARGTHAVSSFMVIGGANETVEVSVRGSVADWVTIVTPDTGDATVTVQLDPSGRTTVEVAVAVPGDTPEGRYEATLVVTRLTESEVRTEVAAPIRISVPGGSVSAARIEVVVPATVVSNARIPVSVRIENTGEVVVLPMIGYRLVDAVSGDVLAEGSLSGPRVEPTIDRTISLSIDHTLDDGAMATVEIAVDLGDRTPEVVVANIAAVDASKLDTGIHPQAIEVVPVGDAARGRFATIRASAINAGTSATSTQLTVDIVHPDGHTERLESAPVLLDIGESTTVELFVPVHSEGLMTVTGRWLGQDPNIDGVYSESRLGGASGGPISAVVLLAAIGVVGSVLLARHVARSRHTTTGGNPEPAPLPGSRSAA